MSLWAQLACAHSVQAQESPERAAAHRDGSLLAATQTHFLPGQKILKYLTQQETALHSARASLEICTAPLSGASTHTKVLPDRGPS